MQLHEPIDMGCKSINTILHHREFLVHVLTQTSELESNELFKSCKALINGPRFICGILSRHLHYLAALGSTKSQDDIVPPKTDKFLSPFLNSNQKCVTFFPLLFQPKKSKIGNRKSQIENYFCSTICFTISFW